jgi:putative nucleotidyltransferase with HDIG domain
MKKKIDVTDLELGMYVSELDRPWLETPFMFQGFYLNDDNQIADLKKHCAYVYIDIEKGPDVSPKKRPGYEARKAALDAADEKIKQRLRELTSTADATQKKRKPYIDRVTFEQEMVRAREYEAEARIAMRSAVESAEKGEKIDLERATNAVTRMADSIIRNPDAMVCLSQLKDVSEYTALHSVRSAILALAFGRHLALSREELIVLGLGAMLHDIGMSKVPKEILDKQGGLDQKEFEIMQKHVQWGVEIVQRSGNVHPGVIDFIMQHHERADGSGYPGQRKKDAIAPAGAIGAIIDVYDAVTSERQYSGGLSAEEALKRMYEWRDKDFNAQLVEEYIKCMGIFPIGSLVELSTGSVGVVVTINRARRLKPKVALVLTASKTPYSHKVVTDLAEHTDAMGGELKIKRVLPAGSFNINPMDHIVQL